MSKLIKDERELEALMKSPDGVFVLFYASWCPFSKRFLPVYEKHAQGRERDFMRFLVDDNEDVCDRHEVEVYPTVLFFKDGKVARRLDGDYHVGLSEKQLAGLMEACGLKKS
jgi:thioredoxin-like negative regulator of GroEL